MPLRFIARQMVAFNELVMRKLLHGQHVDQQSDEVMQTVMAFST